MTQTKKNTIPRRGFLSYIGAGATTFGLAGLGACRTSPTSDNQQSSPGVSGQDWIDGDGLPTFKGPDYPLPLPGDEAPASRYASYEVKDALTLPEGFKSHVIAQWGDVFDSATYPGGKINFGYNNDYTGLLPVKGSDTDYWLVVNHEEVSFRPWQQAYPDTGRKPVPKVYKKDHDSFEVDGESFPQRSFAPEQLPEPIRLKMQTLAETYLDDLGISILRLRRDNEGIFHVLRESDDHKRISTISHRNPSLPAIKASGPASGYLGEVISGTYSNCSGGTSPWGTFFTCEENIQNHIPEWIGPDGVLSSNNRVGGYVSGFDPKISDPEWVGGLGNLLKSPLDSSQFGWVCEIDPVSGQMTKHTWLGRFRHENVAFRVEAGKPLAAYMGDDRRGGHVWKFVSKRNVGKVDDPANSQLLTDGVLYAAQIQEGYKGQWIAINEQTPLVLPDVTHLPGGFLPLPNRPEGGPVRVGVKKEGRVELTVDEWRSQIEAYTGKSFGECALGDLVKTDGDVMGVILMDAFLMANAAGATPTSRPEDLEVHPVDQSVYISFTDHTSGSDGSPDARIFPDSFKENSRQYGAIYRLVDQEPGSTDFSWGKFVESGEVADNGGGFACADNLVFDHLGHIWMVTDISNSSLNFPVTREGEKDQPGGSSFRGIFGNNAMFAIPVKGEKAGIPHCFAIGPMECELTGPTFHPDGRSLILSVQHPGESFGVRKEGTDQTHTIKIADSKGNLMDQNRIVPVGSNFPSGKFGTAPRPAVVCITRAS